jgi:signal transduction histidine kinase
MRSIRRQLMLWCGTAIALMLAVLGVSLYLTLEHSLESQFNASLAARATLLVDTLDWDPGRGFHISPDFTPVTIGPAQGTPRYFQIWSLQGKSVLHPPALGTRNLKFFRPARNAVRFAAVDLPDDHDGRELVIRFREGNSDEHQNRVGPGHVDDNRNNGVANTTGAEHAGQDYILAVARSTDDMDTALSSIAWSLAVYCSLATLCSAALIAWLLSRGLRPVSTIAEQIAKLGAAHLKDRISTHNVPRELIPIVDHLNKLLERVEGAVIREKALTADMAHELRTPLAGLRTATELALTRVRSADEYQRTLRQSLDISIQMQDLVENLLTLARLEAGASARTSEACPLDQMVSRQLDSFSDRIIQRRITLNSNGLKPAVVETPPDLLLLVLRNVLDNAVSYVNESGTIEVSLENSADVVTLKLANTGSAIPAPLVPHVFERFWRGDTSRTDQGRHSGLGLSIVKNVMRRIGGTVIVESSTGGWFMIKLLFPKHGNGQES